jgi:hypothetical protein
MKKTVAFSKNAVNVFFHILTRCNLKCSHCYINKKEHGENTLPIDTIEAWLEVFASKNRAANVIFLGGEPTLHPDLSKAIKKANLLVTVRSPSIQTDICSMTFFPKLILMISIILASAWMVPLEKPTIPYGEKDHMTHALPASEKRFSAVLRPV